MTLQNDTDVYSFNTELAKKVGIAKVLEDIRYRLIDVSKLKCYGTEDPIENYIDYRYLAEFHWMMVALVCEGNEVPEETIAGTLLSAYGLSLPTGNYNVFPLFMRFITNDTVTNITENVKKLLNKKENIQRKNPDKVIELAISTSRLLSYNNKTGTNSKQILSPELPIRCLRDGSILLTFTPDKQFSEFLSMYHAMNSRIPHPKQSMSHAVPESYSTFLNTFYVDLSTYTPATFWTKRYFFKENFHGMIKRALVS